MNKKNAGYFNIVVGIIWSITGIINVIVSSNYSFINTPMGVTYICLAITCMCLSLIYISMGMKKRKKGV